MSAERHAQAAREIALAVFPSDRRGIRAALQCLPRDAYARAAWAICARPPGVALIATGFPVGAIGETDGPPGARALGDAMAALGWSVVGVACPTTRSAVSTVIQPRYPVEVVPAVSVPDAAAACRGLLAKYNPDAVVAIERPGLTAQGRLINMHGQDLAQRAAALDGLMRAPLTIAIGDGGNEVGMGAIAGFLAAREILSAPCVTPATHLLLASVSNWGAYGLAAMLAIVTGTEVLPSPDDDAAWMDALRRIGAADGVTGELTACTVDGHPRARTAAVLDDLRKIQRRYAGAPPGA